MRYRLLLLIAIVLSGSPALGQKPAWVDNPGTYAGENFVAVGIAKHSRVDQARTSAEKKARKAIDKLLKSKYEGKDIKTAMASLRMEAYWQDPATKYYYVLALMPFEAIDKEYGAMKKAEKAKSSAMGAIQMMQSMLKDPDVIVVSVDEEEGAVDEAGEAETLTTMEETSDETKPVVSVKKEAVGEEAKLIDTRASATDFKNKSLGGFKWIDQDGNSKYSFLGDNLTVTMAASESFKPEEGNKKAPRLEMPDVQGDFVVEAKFRLDWEKYYYSGVGLYALEGKQNVFSYVKYNGGYLYLEGYANDIALPRTETNIERLKGYVFFKLVRKGYTFTSYYSTVDGDWIEIGSVETEFPATCSVGIAFTNEESSSSQCKVDYAKLLR